jgi:hypothetical protein
MKNTKARANRRSECLNTRKKTIYETILSEQESKIKVPSSSSKKIL